MVRRLPPACWASRATRHTSPRACARRWDADRVSSGALTGVSAANAAFNACPTGIVTCPDTSTMSPSRVISRCSRSLASTYPRSSASGSVCAAQRRITSRSPSTRTCWAVWTRNASFVSFAGSASASRRCSVVGPSWARILACSTVTRPSATAAAVRGRWSRNALPSRTCARAVCTARWCCSATQSANDFDPPAAHIPSASTTGNRHAPRALDRPAPAASAPATTCACGPSRSRAPTAALIASIDAMYALTAAASAGGSTATSTPAHGSKAAGRSISSLIRPASLLLSARPRSMVCHIDETVELVSLSSE